MDKTELIAILTDLSIDLKELGQEYLFWHRIEMYVFGFIAAWAAWLVVLTICFFGKGKE